MPVVGMSVVPMIYNTLGALVISNTFVARVLDTLHVVLKSHTVYTYAITNFGNILALLKPTWSLVCYILVTAISDSVIRAGQHLLLPDPDEYCATATDACSGLTWVCSVIVGDSCHDLADMAPRLVAEAVLIVKYVGGDSPYPTIPC
ncbi:hypothetical protein C8Q80DRAFT_1122475 [Daedaleopsis nitida]|nr:hypothetical protein C8Q80DRAFT_1122475 [Daedaleopsis nitida]